MTKFTRMLVLAALGALAFPGGSAAAVAAAVLSVATRSTMRP